MYARSKLFFITVISFVMLMGCQPAAPMPAAPAAPADDPAGPRVVTTYSIIYDLTVNVAGDRAQVSSLVPVGQDPHTYEPVPGDLRLVSDADLIIYNGFGMELWFDKLITSAGAEDRVVVASENVTPYYIDVEGAYQGLPDPHAWMDVRKAMQYVERIRDALIELDPDGAEVYRRNAERYLAELEELDTWIREQVEQIPAENRKLVTTENAMRYFAEAYGFEVVGWIFTLAPEEDIPAARITQLIDAIREQQVPAVYVDITLNPRLIERISEETGVPIAGALYIDSLSDPEEGADTYIKMMQANVAILLAGLGG